MKYTKKILVIILMLLVGIGLFCSVYNLAQLSIGYPRGDIIKSILYFDYILFLIPVLFVLGVCISVWKKIYIKGSIVLGYITGLLMILYAYADSVLVALYFVCMGVLSCWVAIQLMFRIRPEADEEMRLLAGIMRGLSYKKKFKGALLLFGVCIICAIYIICPKKWVYLYQDSDDYTNHAYEMNNDVLTAGEEFVDLNTRAGWIFYANKSGNTKVSLLSEISYEDNDDWEVDTRELYVDENMHIHYDADFEYYTTVYEFFFFVIVNAMGLCLVFLLSGMKDVLQNKNREQIENGGI